MKHGSKEEGTMKLSINVVSALLFALSLSLFGCGSESGSGISDSLSLGKQVTSKGAIEKFGSIVVNGVEFKTKGATLHLPDDTAKPERTLQSETEIVDDKLLKLGMVVTIKGVVDDNGTTGTATEIEFRDTLKAKIDDNGVDLVNNTITVMGQKIALDDKIKPLLANLKPGDVVQISGLPDDKGKIKATFIEKKEAAEVEHLTEFEMKGFVSSVNGNTAILKLDLKDVASPGVSVTFPAGTAPALGAFIEVKVPKTFIAGSTIISSEAPHVEDIKVDPAAPGVQISIEGFPATGSIDLTANTLVLNGQMVKFDSATTFVGGTKAILDPTKKIQVEGVITSGVLNAVKITFKALPIKNPGVSRGAIERLGSVVVNGVEFKTTGAVLHLRDDKSKPDRVLQTETELIDNKLLKPGMVVTVKGGFDDNGTTGTATEIEFRNAMEARIDDKGVDFITVMGQKVIVDDKIKAVLSTLNAGDDVAISGVPDDKGGLRATFIEKKSTQLAEFESKGIVSNAAGNTFTLLTAKNATNGGITVTLGSGVTLPANDSFVEVRTLSIGGVVTATKIELENELEAAENEKVEFEGFVASGTAADFVLKGQHVQTTAATVFVGGIKADFVPGMKVEAEGNIVGGILIATKVMFNDNVKINAIAGGAVTAATAATQANFTLLGKKVIITSATALKGLNGTTLDLATVAAGQELEVRGTMAANGTDIIASRVTFKGTIADATKFKTFLQGPVTLTSGGAMTILGTTINTTSSSFRISTDQSASLPSTSTDFFANLKSGVTVVKVKWDPLTGDIATQPVKEAEIQFGKL
jgi:hypothetical protein